MTAEPSEPALADPLREVMLAGLRVEVLRAKLFVTEIEALGIALKSGMITTVQAWRTLRDLGVSLEELGVPPAQDTARD